MSQSKRNAAYSLMDRGSGMVFALGTAMLLLRGLSKEDFAAWGLFLLITYFVEMARNGLVQNGLIRHLTLQRNNPSQFAVISRAALLLNLLFSIFSNLVLWVSLHWIMQTWQMPQLAEVMPVYFITNFVMALLAHFNYLQQAQHEFKGIFQANFMFKGSLFIWVVYCSIMQYGLDLQHQAFALLVGAAMGAVASWRVVKGLKLPHYSGQANWSDIWHWMKELSSFGKWVLGTNLCTMFYKSIDKLALGYLVGPAAFALYDAAGKATQLVEAPSFSIAAVAFPQGAVRMEQEGPAGIKRLYERSVGAILAIILPFILAILLFSKPFMLLFAGSAYLESANLLVITAFFGLFLPFAVQFGTILDATGKPHVNFAYTLFSALLNLALSWVFILKFGMMGAALATLVGYMISFVLLQIYLYKNFKINALNAFLHVPSFYSMGWEMIKSGRIVPRVG